MPLILDSTNLLAQGPLRPLAEAFPITALDIGSRGGFEPDIKPLAFAVHALGFEPEAEAHARLSQNPGPWRSLKHLPTALSGTKGERVLHIARDPISSSLLEPDPTLGRLYDKPQFFEITHRVPLATDTLDGALSAHDVSPPHYLKIDVEGAELEILEGAPKALGSLLVIKTEAVFAQARLKQTEAAALLAFLAQQGFWLMDMHNAAHWRHKGYRVHPQADTGPQPYSRGRLIQADLLFFKDPARIAAPEDKVRAALLALAHGFVDHAQMLLEDKPTQAICSAHGLADLNAALDHVSRQMGKVAVSDAALRHLRLGATFLRSLFNHWRR